MSSSSILVALMGRKVLQIIAQERKVVVYEEKLPENFMLRYNVFLCANENYLLIGRCRTIPPEISCQSLNSELADNHLMLLKATAQCN